MPPLSSGRIFSYLCSLPDGYNYIPHQTKYENGNYQHDLLLSKITEIINKKEQYPELVAKLENIIIEYENKS